MRWVPVLAGIALLAIMCGMGCINAPPQERARMSESDELTLPEPAYTSDTSIEEALLQRRSVRTYASDPLNGAELGQLLWACQGITDTEGHRTAPSAGALYPLRVYAVVSRVEGVPPGVYRYVPEGHALHRTIEGDMTPALQTVAHSQAPVGEAPANIVICALPERTTGKYGNRGIRYVHIEAGHAAQNVYLQAVALDLGTVSIGAFEDAGVRRILNLSPGEEPLYIMPVGRR
jgi:SagB-type dehydrogenase family enzyme